MNNENLDGKLRSYNRFVTMGWDGKQADNIFQPCGIEDQNKRINSYRIPQNWLFSQYPNMNTRGGYEWEESTQKIGAIDKVSGTTLMMDAYVFWLLMSFQGKNLVEGESYFSQLNNCDKSVVRKGVDWGLLEKPGNYKQVREIHRVDEERLSYWVTLTPECPSRCPMCFAGQSDPHSQEMMDRRIPSKLPEEVMRQIISDIPRSADRLGLNRIHIKFGGGGEPTMAMPEMYSFLELCEKELGGKYDLTWAIVTNGFGLTDKHLKEIKARNGYIALSIGGDREGHDLSRPLANGQSSFDLVINKLRRIQQFDIPNNLTLVLTRQNMSTAYKLPQYLDEGVDLGWVPIMVSLARPSKPEDLKTFVPNVLKLDKMMWDWSEFEQNYSDVMYKYNIPEERWVYGVDYLFVGPAKLHQCFSGEHYIAAGGVIDTNGTTKPMIASCHNNAMNGFIPAEGGSYIEQVNQEFTDQGYREAKTALGGCANCEIRGWCGGWREAGGCPIQRKNLGETKPLFCDFYVEAAQIALQRKFINLLDDPSRIISRG